LLITPLKPCADAVVGVLYLYEHQLVPAQQKGDAVVFVHVVPVYGVYTDEAVVVPALDAGVKMLHRLPGRIQARNRPAQHVLPCGFAQRYQAHARLRPTLNIPYPTGHDVPPSAMR
jgi:hypothetical protein